MPRCARRPLPGLQPDFPRLSGGRKERCRFRHRPPPGFAFGYAAASPDRLRLSDLPIGLRVARYAPTSKGEVILGPLALTPWTR
jgi:hypothetical protein